MDWKKLLGAITESVDEELRLRNAYLIAENRLLRQQINGRVQLTDRQHKELAEIGQQLGKKALEEIATVAKPATILAWRRQCADQQVHTSELRKSVGRPRIDREIETLAVRMARENRSWGYDRIQGALKHLGYMISDQTVGNILRHHSIPPAPERKKTVTWCEFIRFHLEVLRATNFFQSEMWSWCELTIFYLLCFIHCARQPVHSVGMFLHPWTQKMGSFLLHAFHVRAQIKREGDLIRTFAPPWPMRCGEGVLGKTVSKIVPIVLCLSARAPRPVRDGPMRRHLGSGRQLRDDNRKAA
jgi:hypothetical protein